MSNSVWLRGGLVFGLVVFILYYLSPVMTPFFLGGLLAYLGNPFVSFLHKKHFPRTIGVILVFLIALVILLGFFAVIVPLIQEQFLSIVQRVPDFLVTFQTRFIPWINQHMQINLEDSWNFAGLKQHVVQHKEKISQWLPILIKTLTQSTLGVIDFIMNLLLVPVVAFYLMRDWPRVIDNLYALFPMPYRDTTKSLAHECDEVISAFFKGQLLVMFGLAIIYSAGLSLIGLRVAILIGLLSGLLAIVPYLGFTIGIVAASVAMYWQTHDFVHVTWVWGVYLFGQLMESSALTPLLVGDKIGLHPVAVIFAVLTGGWLFGFLGVLLALPVAAIILVALKRILYATHA